MIDARYSMLASSIEHLARITFMKFAYYPGCAAEATVKEADLAMRTIAGGLDIELKEYPNMSCCGAGVLHEERPNLSIAINARNFAIAERDGVDLLTICNTCLLTMLKSKKALDEDDKLRERVNKSLARFNLEYKGAVRIKHLLWILAEEENLKKISKKIKKRLTNLKVAPFYGCHIVRPEEVMNFEDGRDPSSLERVIELTGATPVKYNERLECCGFHVMLVNKKATAKMTDNCLSPAKKAGADLLVTPCTLCQLTLDSYQYMAKEKIGLPVIHLPQLLGLALGIDAEKLGFDKHMVGLPKELFT